MGHGRATLLPVVGQVVVLSVSRMEAPSDREALVKGRMPLTPPGCAGTPNSNCLLVGDLPQDTCVHAATGLDNTRGSSHPNAANNMPEHD
eukprot:13995402-Alexandrium_andersonii.AAC.1